MILLHTLTEATPGEEAKQKGLHHVGWGRYADSTNKVVAKSVDGRLVFLTHQNVPSGQTKHDPEYDELRNTADQHENVVMSKQPIKKLQFRKQVSYGDTKPHGLWYAKGASWIDFVEASEMTAWKGSHLYSLEINKDKICILDTQEKMINFTKEYGKLPTYYSDPEFRKKFKPTLLDMRIDWKKVSQQYSGIEIPNYFPEMRKLGWYSTWDVESGCVWFPEAIKSIKHIPIG